MTDVFDNIKKLKIFGKFLIGTYKSGLFFKELDKPDEHSTIGFYQGGIMDVHKTKEGSEGEKEYKSLGKFDLVKTVEKIVSDPESFMNGIKTFIDSGKEVTFDESEFIEYGVVNFKTQEEIASIVTRKKDNVVIPIESLEEFFPFKDVIPWNEAREKIKNNAFVVNKEGIPIGYILKVQERFLLFSINIMENPFVSKFISMMTNPEKLESEKPHDTQG